MTEKDETTVAADDTTPDDTELVDTDLDESEAAVETAPPPAAPGRDRARILAYGILPGLVLILCLAAGYLKYVDNSERIDNAAREQSVQAARNSTITLLSYTPDKVEQQLGDALNLLTGGFRDTYTTFTRDVVIPGAQQQQVSAVTTVPSAASVSADPNRAVVLLFVNQTVSVGGNAPTNTASSVRVTLEKSGDQWLISAFDPV